MVKCSCARLGKGGRAAAGSGSSASVAAASGALAALVDTTDAHHPRVAIPYTFVLDAERVIFKIYNGWWYLGRPTVDELRMDLRTLMSRRPDWWYNDTPAPYTRPES